MEEKEIFYPTNLNDWRNWLEKNHLSKESVWVVLYTKASDKSSITWRDAVDVALCFGWIDSKKIKIDSESSHQFFSKRKAKSTWSKINKEIVQKLIDQGLMQAAGYESIEKAKQNGSWTILDEVEELVIPEDLLRAFHNNEGSLAYFNSLSKTNKKMILQWIVLAKRPETRVKRINEVAELASKNRKPKHLP